MKEIFDALEFNQEFVTTGNLRLPSCFAVTDLATASLGAVGKSIASLLLGRGVKLDTVDVRVDSRLASLWFAGSISPVGWELPPIWDAIAGDYQGADGWIKLHTNLKHHRKAALEVLGCDAKREGVEKAVQRWRVDDLEQAIVSNNGVAAAMRSRQEWADHPQGQALASEPLIGWSQYRSGKHKARSISEDRPLQGLRVLDLTRVLAGPVATRTLAGFGAQVLRVDPPDWDEPNVVPDITLGKNCCRLDLHDKTDRAVFEELLAGADLLVHGYRPDALAGLGYGPKARQAIAPKVIEICLDAYGWSGPWAGRRGFDSLVQMSCGIADEGQNWAGADRPRPLPVQALDHATGYLMAAAAIKAVCDAQCGRGIRTARLSLARTAELLCSYRQKELAADGIEAMNADFSDKPELTPWGPARRLNPPLRVGEVEMDWELGARELGSASAEWNKG